MASPNINLLGDVYPSVSGVTLPKQGGGTATFPWVEGSQTITQNGTYDVSSLSEAVVNVSGGGGSSWTKVCEKTVNVSTTSTTLTTETWATGHSEIWNVSKYILVRIRDTAGKRNSHFYGSDNFFVLPQLASTTNTQKGLRYIYRVSSTGRYSSYETTGANGYGVYADMVYNNGNVRLCWRYNSNYSLTIDGGYKVEVYILDPPAGSPIYE